MKIQIKKWTLRLLATSLCVVGLLIVIVLTPILTYANKTTYNNFFIYHHKPLDPLLISSLDEATVLVKSSECYNSMLSLDICLNDGATYPTLIRTLRGRAFAWGFYDKVVLQGDMNCKRNILTVNNYHWNLTQLLAHEMTHCYQFDKLGLWKSNPVANIPNWKWEGYAEYISRQNSDQTNLFQNIYRWQHIDQAAWEITFEDNSIAPVEYYRDWILVQYCMDIKKMTYEQILNDQTNEHDIHLQMMKWFEAKIGEAR